MPPPRERGAGSDSTFWGLLALGVTRAYRARFSGPCGAAGPAPVPRRTRGGGRNERRAGAWLALVPSILVPLTPSQQKVKLSKSRPSVGRHVGRSAPVSHCGRGVVFIADTVHARTRTAHAATHRVEVPSTGTLGSPPNVACRSRSDAPLPCSFFA